VVISARGENVRGRAEVIATSENGVYEADDEDRHALRAKLTGLPT
jgi:hypothetical protein